MSKPIRSMKDIVNRRNVKRVCQVYLTVLLCVGLAGLLTGCVVVTGSESVTVALDCTGSLVGL